MFGHLVVPEFRRALGRGWLVVMRSLVALVLGIAFGLMLWFWWIATMIEPGGSPLFWVQWTLSTSAMILLTICVAQAPAVLAGSLAGERERGVLQLLLTTAVTPREIVTGRLVGKLSQVAMILMAGLPILAMLFAWNGLGLKELIAFFLLLAATAFGGGGLAVGASILSRRGRDALLSVYILMLVLLLSPLLRWVGLPVGIAEVLLWFNPFSSLNRLIFDGELAPALATSGAWFLMGLGGTGVAAWRLRPSCLAVGDDRRKSRRLRWVPELGDRPMLWKELYIERVGTLGRFGRWLGIAITLAFGGGSLVLAAIIVVDLFRPLNDGWSVAATNVLATVLSGASAGFLGWLLQWATGLRAAVSIASERERETWDALLMSPLEPAQIIWAKLFGSLYALRWMVAAMLLAWSLAVVVGAISVYDYADWIIGNTLACALMAAIGVRASLSLPTATKAMTWTVALWLASGVAVACLACSVIALIWLLVLSAWSTALSYGYVTFNSMTVVIGGGGWGIAWLVIWNLVTLLLTVMIATDTALRFDRLAGRMAGGAMATAVDQWTRGGQTKPVFIPAKRRKAVETEAPNLPELPLSAWPAEVASTE